MFISILEISNKKTLSPNNSRQHALSRWENEGGAPILDAIKSEAAEEKINYRHHSSKIGD